MESCLMIKMGCFWELRFGPIHCFLLCTSLQARCFVFIRVMYHFNENNKVITLKKKFKTKLEVLATITPWISYQAKSCSLFCICCQLTPSCSATVHLGPAWSHRSHLLPWTLSCTRALGRGPSAATSESGQPTSRHGSWHKVLILGTSSTHNRTEILTSELVVVVYIYNPSIWELKASLGYLPSSRLACTIKDDVSKKKKTRAKGTGKTASMRAWARSPELA